MKTADGKTGKEAKAELPALRADRARSIITVDYERYAPLLDDPDLTEEQKREFLQTLWSIVCEFVALGFEVHPAQQAQKACGKAQECGPEPTSTGRDGVYLDQKSLVREFVDSADLEADRVEEGVDG